VRCTWCNRIKVGGRFVSVDPSTMGDGDLPERTTPGICPQCFEPVSARAAAARRPHAA
jgi:hypothetical protein